MATFNSLMSNLGSFLGGQPEEVQQFSRYSPENQQSFNELISGILGQYQQGGDFSQGFEPFAQKARSQFQQQTVPSIAERFTSMGGQRSSAFPQALGQAGAGMETDLAAQGAQFGQNQQQLMQRLLGMGQQESVLRPQSSGLLGGIASGGAQGLASALPLLLQLLSGGR